MKAGASALLGSPCDGIFDQRRILLGCTQDLKADDIPVFIVIEDDPGLILIAFLNVSLAQDNAKNVDFLVVVNLHSGLQYFSILLVR